MFFFSYSFHDLSSYSFFSFLCCFVGSISNFFTVNTLTLLYFIFFLLCNTFYSYLVFPTAFDMKILLKSDSQIYVQYTDWCVHCTVPCSSQSKRMKRRAYRIQMNMILNLGFHLISHVHVLFMQAIAPPLRIDDGTYKRCTLL